MIRVFIVDDDDMIRSAVCSMVELEPDMSMVGEHDRVEGALELIKAAKPSVVLLDVQLPDGHGTEIASALRDMDTPSGVIMISVQKDIAFLKEAMNAGARDYLLKPFGSDEMSSAVRKLAEEMSLNRKGPEIVGIWSSRGGSGGTSLTVSLGRAIRKQGSNVALVDGDLYLGDIAYLMDVPPERSWADWGRDRGESSPERYLVESNGVSIMAAPMNPAQAELVKSGMAARFIEGLSSYDFVLIDLPRSFDEITLEMAEKCDRIWLVGDMTCTGVKNLRLFSSLLEQLRMPCEDISVILNFFVRAERDTRKKMESEFNIRAVLPLDDSVEKGWIQGKSASGGFFGSPYAKAVNGLASYLIKDKI